MCFAGESPVFLCSSLDSQRAHYSLSE
jgi:hypothetical protein